MDMRFRLATPFLLVLLLAGAWPASPQDAAPGSTTAAALDELVRQLVNAAAERDDAAVDHIVCLDDLLHAHMGKRESLGLEPGFGIPEHFDQRRAALRARVYAFVDRLVSRGREVESTDAGRVELFVDQGAGYESLVGADGAPLEIHGGGPLAVRMAASDRPVDIATLRIRGRWCLAPVELD